MEAYEIVAQIEKAWPNYPKAVPFVERQEEKTRVSLAFEHDGRWVLISLYLGPRGGIKERVTLLDPSQEIQANRLIVDDFTTWGGLSLLPLDKIRHRWNNGEDGIEVCKSVLEDWWENSFEGDPNYFFDSILHYQGDRRPSVRAVSGGLPGTGRYQGRRRR